MDGIGSARRKTRGRALALIGSSVLLGGCASFYPVETTPEGILSTVSAGDTVRIRTRADDEVKMLVWRLDDAEIRGWLDGGDPQRMRTVRYDRIETIDVQRLNLRKAMLTTFVPVVVAAIIFCNNEDCETRSGVTADF